MKPLLALIIGFVSFQLFSQTTIDLPIKMTATVTFPLSSLQPTNAYRTRLWLTNNVIAPVGPRIDLKISITSPTQFQLGTFPPDSSVTLFMINTASNKIQWPSGLVPMGGPLPTNAARAVILFEEAFGQVWCYPATP